MLEKIILTMLTSDHVVVQKQKYLSDGDVPVGSLESKSYSNNLRGRILVQDEIPEPQQTAILTIWGDTPTVEETTDI